MFSQLHRPPTATGATTPNGIVAAALRLLFATQILLESDGRYRKAGLPLARQRVTSPREAAAALPIARLPADPSAYPPSKQSRRA